MMRLHLRQLCLHKWRLLSWLVRSALQAHGQMTPRLATTSSAKRTRSTTSKAIGTPKVMLTPGSRHHDSLSSYLEYAKRVNLDPESTVYVGTHYEYTTALALKRLGFVLLRVGRAQDAGVDLIGHWNIEPFLEPVHVIVQCKASKTSVEPSRVRELHGSLQKIPADWKNKHVLGLLVTTTKASKGVLDAISKSQVPLAFLFISREGLVQQFVWNRAAADRGLEGVGVTVRHSPRVLEAKASGTRRHERTVKEQGNSNAGDIIQDVQLTWMGLPIRADKMKKEHETVGLTDTITLNNDVNERGRSSSTYKELELGGAGTTTQSKSTVKRGQPKGSKSAVKRGRPKGSKNKPK